MSREAFSGITVEATHCDQGYLRETPWQAFTVTFELQEELLESVC